MTSMPFTLDHVKRLKFVREAGFVAGGPLGYYLVAEIDDEAARDTHSLWLFGADGGAATRLGESLGDVGSPSPSPDGSQIAVLAETDGKRQIALVPVDGAPPRTLTSLPQGVTGRPVWSPDGRTLAFTAGPAQTRDPSLPYRVDRHTYRFDGLGYLDDVAQDIYLVDVDGGVTRQLTDDRCLNSEPQWSPDGRRLAYLVSYPPERPWTWLPDLRVVEMATGELRSLLAGWGTIEGATWHGNDQIAYLGSAAADGYLLTARTDLWTVALAGGEPERRSGSLGPGLGSHLQVDMPIYNEIIAPRICVVGDAAYVSGQVAGRIAIYRIALSGAEAVELVLEDEGSRVLLDVELESGALLHLATTLLEPPDLMLGSARITALNDELLATVARPDVHTFKVTAPDGVEIDVWAMTPATDGPWPTVLSVHGGPYGAYGNAYMIDFEILVGAGFAVVFHNFRGSYGYGAEFAGLIRGDWGRNGSLDHHATLDEAVRLGIADPDRLGVSGLSHGGFATTWLIGTSDRFKAAVAENPVTNWPGSYGVIDMEWFVVAEQGGTPYEVPEVYRDRSPLTYAPDCRTPLLLVIGEEDWRCNAMHSEQYYRVLKTNGVPSAMLRLPGCSHMGTHTGPVPARLAQNEALVGWFTEHLGS